MPDRHAVIRPEDRGVARERVSDLYDNFVAPPYENGAYVIDLTSIGQLGYYVLLEDDSEYVYAVPFGTAVISGGASIVELARQRRARAE